MSYDLNQVVEQVVKTVLSTESGLTLRQAEALAAAVETRAKQMGMKVVVAVCDEGGNPLLLHRQEGAFIASCDIAQNKAYTSVALQMPTKDLASLAAPGGSLYGIQFTNNGKIVIFGGGVPLIRNGKIVGGFGVSGGTAKQDTELGDYAKQFFAEELL
ncbi:MAG: heme-binding protein [Clostridiales bacterium]|nr:heme-binding protein [Clostridiales bacterium]